MKMKKQFSLPLIAPTIDCWAGNDEIKHAKPLRAQFSSFGRFTPDLRISMAYFDDMN